jgi:hypothetical protein
MKYEINKTEKGKFFVSINTKRIGRTNFARKWEAINELKHLLQVHGEQKLIDWSNK